MSVLAMRRRRPAYRYVAPAAVILLVCALATFGLTTRPATWYDEGLNLQAARNLARSGRYGLIYAEELRPFDLQLTTGPTVIVPVALVFKALGVGLAQGRAVMVVYSLLAALGLYRVGRALYGPTVAGLAVVVLCASDRAGPGSTRDVVGEIAAVAYLFWGVDVFVAARRTGRATRYAVAGALLGLAVLTKGQVGLVLPAVGGVWLLTRGRPVGFSARHLLVLLAALVTPVALWQSFQLISLGVTGYVGHLDEQSANLSGSALAPPLSRALSGAAYLLFSPFAPLGLAALVYVWLDVRRRGWRREPAERLLLPTFAAISLVWYVGFSAAYGRYTLPLAAICSLFLAVLLRDLALTLRATGRNRAGLVPATLLVVLALPLVAGLAQPLLAVGRPADTSAQELAGIISRDVEAGATIESIEWQLDVLTEHPFHHPIPYVPAVPYEVPAATTYLVDGPMAKSVRLYGTELERRPYRRVAVAGAYDLYRREPDSAAVP
jgi:4-amino-4-deoxy-L-arabinose transferase-like glycosyltransferase